MNTREKIDLLDRTLHKISGSIATADHKVTHLFTVSTAMLGFEISIFAKARFLVWYDWVFIIVSALLLSFCMLSAFFVIHPRLSGESSRSVLYFQHIAMFDCDGYKNRIDSLKEDELFEDYVKQCYRNAEIARDKFAWLRRANFALFMSIIPWMIVMMVGFSSI